ncbi:MAG TPA: type IV pilus assembly protein PilM [Pirellulales bacterium]|nr:type IV pilus assembly protein PilM [Pirellulales bacterium]
MARSDAVWGIDIGQCALKALRLRPHEENSRVTADAFDYIEYPKILSQPDVDPVELVQEALKQFLSRNSVRGDQVVVSVSGQSGLARFIKLPPVESKKIPDIVKYEAKQQIPFALEDVVWDFQRMAGGSMIEGFAMETEVGLFAMKRDQVFRALKPFNDAGIEVDIVQLTPLALYNFVAFDQMPNLPPDDEYDAESPPESVVLVSLGTDTTDLVVTNGFRVWQRSIPIGGNHFTKALTKELKLTFASAEHLKRNATQAEDPKALFQAMRPVFNDLLTEVQRSIGYFSNLDRRAKIGRAIALGNAMKLPGLQRYLTQNLGFELIKLESFRCMSGTAVVDSPVFKDNLPAFGVCYGLALQGLRDTKIKTNLLPREIANDRMVRAKKPWAVGAAAVVLLGLSVSFGSHWRAANSVRMEGHFEPAVKQAEGAVSAVNQAKSAFEGAKGEYGKTAKIGEGFVQNVSARDVLIKVYKAINLCLPRNEGERPEAVADRNEISIEDVECVYFDKLEDWYGGVKDQYTKQSEQAARVAAAEAPAAPPVAPPAAAGAPNGVPADGAAPPAGAAGQPGAPPADPAAQGAPADGGAPAAAAPAGDAPAGDAAAPADGAGPSGPGWVFQLRGHHYHNKKNDPNQGEAFLSKALLHNLRKEFIEIPLEERQPGGPIKFPVKALGISYPVLVNFKPIDYSFRLIVEDLDADDGQARGGQNPMGVMPEMPGGIGGGGPTATKTISAPRFDFIVQFCWQAPSAEQLEKISAEIPSGEALPEQPMVAEPAAPAPAAGSEPAAKPEAAPAGEAKPAPAAAQPPAAGANPPAGGASKPAENKPAAATEGAPASGAPASNAPPAGGAPAAAPPAAAPPGAAGQ